MEFTTVELPYGEKRLEVRLPRANLMGVLYPDEATDELTHLDETSILHEALEHPIGTPRLCEIVHKGQKVVLVTSDLTRPCPSERMLPPILEELAAAGIPDQDILIVIGLGLHRPMSEQEIERAVSPAIYHRFHVLNHDAKDTVRLGTTSYGTPVEIFRPVVEADVRVCLANLEFHYFAGYSGGAKSILPGVASQATVTANHAMMTRAGAHAGHIDDNPVRLDLEEGVAMLGVDFILNVVVDGEHHILEAIAGDVIAAHRKGCALIAARGKVKAPSKADIVLASAGGFPKDINLYQAHKGLENASYFLRPGGALILAAECREGLGSPTFESWIMAASSPKEVLDRIQKEFVLGGHKAAAIAAIEQRADISMVTQMPDDLVRHVWFTPYDSLQTALQDALDRLGPESKILVLPQAGSMIPDFNP